MHNLHTSIQGNKYKLTILINMHLHQRLIVEY